MSPRRSLSFLFALSAIALGTQMSHASLIAHWPLDTDAGDSTGNGFNGTVVGGTVNFGGAGANANTGSSASFPDNGHIDVPFDAALNPESFTVALWANADSTAGFASPITSRDDVTGVSVWGFVLYNNSDGNWDFWTGGGGPSGSWDRNIGPAVTLDTWTHVAISYDALTGTKSLWVNGVAEATDIFADQYLPNGSVEMEDLHIGAGADPGDTFFFGGSIDDIGLWDEALDEATIQSIMMNGISSGLPDPTLSVSNPVDLALDGTVQQFPITITNIGASQNLTVSAATFTGDPNFSVVSLPGIIPAGGNDDLTIEFDPAGSNGAFEADLEITSNDGLNPVRTITVRGNIHDPMLVADATLDFGTSTTASLTVTNDGATRALNLNSVSLSGDTANFGVTNFPPSIPALGGSGTIEIAFDAKGGEGTFRAILTINSNDPIEPNFAVGLVATVSFSNPLVAWWPLDADGTDASGNGFDGTIVGAPIVAPGANGTTGGSLEFDGGTTRIDVPYDAALNPDDFTVTLWANADTTAGFASPITSRDDVAGPITHGYVLYNNSGGAWDFWTGDGDAGWDTLAGPPVAIATWSHLAITYDSATDVKTLYLDGDVVATDNVPQSGVAQYVKNGTIETEDLHIGAGQDDGNNFWFDGKIDDVALFRTALSEAEIESIMASGVAGFIGATQLFQMLPLEFGPGPGQITVSWTSQNGAKYALDRSSDMTTNSWEELDDDIDSSGEITTFLDSSPPPGAKRLYYRARRL